ncbi:MAG: hypothetical protein NC898_04585 [Candidatus Omnitrophica bacterium]|nr:hypothetical protein [Candidatus Omnitrophota bacterium]
MNPIWQPYFPSSFLEENVRYHDGYNTHTSLHITLEPWVNLGDIVQGIYDNYFRDYAKGAKLWTDEIRFRFGHEMIHDNDPSTPGWYPWQDQPLLYTRAFQHIHDIFYEVGADNVKFVWAPNWTPSDLDILKEYYPGKDYVEWIGFSGYNWGNPWRSFDEIFSEIYLNIIQNSDFFGEKPIMLSEFASAEGELKDEWIKETFEKIEKEYPQIKAFYWFNINKERDWRINSSAEALSAFRTAMSSPYFISHPTAGEPQPISEIKVKINIPNISMLQVNITKIENGDWQPSSNIDFDTLTYDPQLHIFRANSYYALDVGIICNEPDWTITHTVTAFSNGRDTLDENVNVMFMKQNQAGGEEIAKYKFANSNVSFNKVLFRNGEWLRIYYGIATGSLGDAPGAKPITLEKSSGNYSGSVILSLITR